MTRAVRYLRVSTEDQARGDRYSLPGQERRTLEHIQQHGYTDAGIYCDHESGRKDARPQYQQMLAVVRRGEAKVIIVRWLDRFGRNPREILSRVWELQDLGCRIECSDEDVAEELILLIRAAMAGKESERISARVRPALRARAAEGKQHGTPPSGMRCRPDGKLEPDPDPRWQAIDLAFELFDPEGPQGSKLSLRDVCQWLNGHGYITATGGPWQRSALWRILVNPAYAGDLRGYGAVVRDAHTGRIPRERFDRVQTRLRIRQYNRLSPGERPGVIGAGLVYCYQGHRMVYHVVSRNGHRWGFWFCVWRGQTGQCDAPTVSARWLEAELRRQFAGVRLPSVGDVERVIAAELCRRLADNPEAKRLTVVEHELGQLQQQEGRLIDMRTGGEIDREQFLGRVEPLRRHLANLEVEAKRLRAVTDPADLRRLLVVLHEKLNRLLTGDIKVTDLVAVVAASVERVVIEPERAVRVAWRPEARLLLGL